MDDGHATARRRVQIINTYGLYPIAIRAIGPWMAVLSSRGVACWPGFLLVGRWPPGVTSKRIDLACDDEGRRSALTHPSAW